MDCLYFHLDTALVIFYNDYADPATAGDASRLHLNASFDTANEFMGIFYNDFTVFIIQNFIRYSHGACAVASSSGCHGFQ